jgi:predicted DNA repair protein MutK
MVRAVPKLLSALSSIGIGARLWVGGGILLHGMEDIGLEKFPHTVHEVADAIGASMGNAAPIVEWLTGALASAIVGAAIGLVIVVIVRQFTTRPEDLVVDA